MRDIQPTAPTNLNAYARELLESFAGQQAAAEIVLGGGVALSHYLEYRGTVDLDAWWRTGVNNNTRELARQSMQTIAAKHGLNYVVRSWGDTESHELLRGARKVFSFQISTRTRYLDIPLTAGWTPVMIETLRDNVASKMTALVERGAPRDLRDVHELCTRQLLSTDECWKLWLAKNPGSDTRDGRAKVLFHVERLEIQRPLDKIQPLADRAAAESLRRWFKLDFCAIGAA